MRLYLNCPFAEKDQAKSLGAKWDAAKRLWYAENMEDLTPFQKWFKGATSRHDSAVETPRKNKASFVTIGANAPQVFRSEPYPPWEDEPDAESIRVLRSFA